MTPGRRKASDVYPRWNALFAEWNRIVATPRAAASFESMRQRALVLWAFRDMDELVAFLREISTRPEDLDAKDEVFLALVAAVQRSDGRDSQVALALLSLALWPALTRIYAQTVRQFGNRGDALCDVSERFLTTVLRLSPDNVSRVAATLVMNTERNVMYLGWSRARVKQAELRLSRSEPDPSFGPSTPECEAMELYQWAEKTVGRTLVDWVVADKSYVELAASNGLSPEAMKKRVQRARERLEAQALADFDLSRARPAAGHRAMEGQKRRALVLHDGPPGAGYVRIPGLYQMAEITILAEKDEAFWFERADAMEDGTPLYAVHRPEPEHPRVAA